MSAILFVGLGGAAGAMLRYILNLIPLRFEFPLITFLINFAGCFIIGFIIGFAQSTKKPSENALLFLKTGFCGGFTTFSTFSSEVLNMLENKNYTTGIIYAIISFVLCILGVWLGKALSKTICGI